MAHAQQIQEQEAPTCDNFELPHLINKEQLNPVITNKNGTPDYLAINIYFDTLRSWYNPKIGYKKDGNVYHINKLKTPGVFLDYKRLAETHGCSKETVRQKIVKLERLGFVHRSFQHRKTATTKSYNQLIAYVWKDTPHFYNPIGIYSDQVPTLTPQTNHEYIENKYGVCFASQAPQNKGFNIGGGIQACLDTKELNNIISKDIRSNVQVHESSFSHNSKKIESNENHTSNLLQFPKVPSKNKNRLFNQRKKLTNSEIKARVYKPFTYSKPKTLGDMLPLLDHSTCDELRSKSGRDFSDSFIAQRVLAMSKKRDLASRNFRTRKGFIAYMTPALKNELHDAVKTSGVDFKLRVNMTEEDKYSQIQEEFLNKIEQEAIIHVCPDNQLKAKLANVLEPSKAYNLLSTYNSTKVQANKAVISLKLCVELSELDRKVILQQVKAVYETYSTNGECKFIDKLEIVFPEKVETGYNTNVQATKQENTTIELPKEHGEKWLRELYAVFS